jgi:hypothetical protein
VSAHNKGRLFRSNVSLRMQGKLLQEMKCSVKEQTCEECCANWSHCVEFVRVPATRRLTNVTQQMPVPVGKMDFKAE